MKLKRSTYIIGAGASYELGLPTGEELKSIIADLLNINFNLHTQTSGDSQIVDALKPYSKSKNEDLNLYRKECIHISKNMPLSISIDNFIDTQKGNEKLELCGKMGIVQSIIQAEKNCLLYQKRNQLIDFSELSKTWYLSFFKTITENCVIEDLPKRLKLITLIIFNYDRCLEHFLINALQGYYRIDNTEAITLISNIKIIHPYGTIGPLPWQDTNSHNFVKFGESINTNCLIESAQNIKTFTEGVESNSVRELHDIMSKSKRIIFLGFAYHKLNMKLLGKGGFVASYQSEDVECYGTSFGMSESDKKLVIDSIQALYDEKIKTNIDNLTCYDSFNEYSRSLGY